MHALGTKDYGPPSGYEVLDVAAPEVTKPDEILIKVHAASVNPVDVRVASGVYKAMMPAPMPYLICYDVSGTVVAVGPEVPSKFKPGVEVFSRVNEQHRGTIAEFCLSTAEATALKTPSLSHIDAASLPLASLTAFQSLQRAADHFEGGLKGKTVYVPGGLSAVGATAVQLAKRVFQASKVITTLSTAKMGKYEALIGADVVDQVIDYTKQDPAKAIAAGTVDFIFDVMDEALNSLHLMKKGGIIVSVSGTPFGPDARRVMGEVPFLEAHAADVGAKTAPHGIAYSYLFHHPLGSDLNKLGEYAEKGLLKPVVGRVAHFSDLKAMQDGCAEVLSGKGGIGKFVIEVQSK